MDEARDDAGTLPLKDYGVIGNCQTAALVSARGAIEWLCLPRFDGPSVFAALLDPEKGGRLQVRPTSPYRATQSYVPGTPVLRTDLECDRGRARITDFMPMGADRTDLGEPGGAPAVCRVIEGLAGELELRVLCDPRPAYAKGKPQSQRREGWWVWSTADQIVRVQTDLDLKQSVDSSAIGARVSVRPGSVHAIVIDGEDAAAVANSELPKVVRGYLETTANWWHAWGRQLRYSGPYADHVLRSAITLKLLCHGPSGAGVAAPTTSLPEIPGGTWNWDYRYCWLRDASMTVRALLKFGFTDEAQGFLRWIVSATQLPRGLRVLYDIDGNPGVPERKLRHLGGYGGAQPVRIGNAASRQLQLDTYGALVDAISLFVRQGGALTERSRSLLQRVGERACDLWTQRDNGIWESRLKVKHHTLSKAMCWVALERLLDIHRSTGLDVPTDRFARVQRDIRRSIEDHGVSPEGHYRLNYDEEAVDPSLLLLSLYGYEPAESDRMMRTLRRIDQEMGPPPLLGRHAESKGGEKARRNAFGIAGFWAVEYLAAAGLIDEAEERFEKLIESTTALGLLAEEVDRESGHARGNFPQAFSHIGLLNAAAALARARQRETPIEDHDRRTEQAAI